MSRFGIHLIFLATLVAFTLSASPACRSFYDLKARSQLLWNIVKAYRSAFRTEGLYVAYKCQTNTVNLFNHMREAIPELKPEDFEVLIFSHREWNEEHLFDRQFGMLGQKIKDNSGANKIRVHVALRYRNFIFDLDSDNPQAVYTIKKYTETFFIPANYPQNLKKHDLPMATRENIVAYRIPGEVYLNIPEPYNIKMDTLLKLIEGVPPIAVEALDAQIKEFSTEKISK